MEYRGRGRGDGGGYRGRGRGSGRGGGWQDRSDRQRDSYNQEPGEQDEYRPRSYGNKRDYRADDDRYVNQRNQSSYRESPNYELTKERSERGEKYGKRSSGFERRNDFDSPYRGESRNYDRADRPRDRDRDRDEERRHGNRNSPYQGERDRREADYDDRRDDRRQFGGDRRDRFEEDGRREYRGRGGHRGGQNWRGRGSGYRGNRDFGQQDERNDPNIDEAFGQVELFGRQAENPDMGGPPPGFEARSPRNVGQIDMHMQAVADPNREIIYQQKTITVKDPNMPRIPRDERDKRGSPMSTETFGPTSPPPSSSRTTVTPPPSTSRASDPDRPQKRQPLPPQEEVRPANELAIVAPKKKIAERKDKLERPILTTNFWDLNVNSRMVYRYDVNVNAIIPSTDPTKDARKIDITKGPRDDAAKIDRNRLCLEALKRGLELYNVLSQNGAAIHDGAAILYSNEDIAHVVKDQVISLDAKDVPRELTAYIGRPDISTFEITITNVAEGAYSFDMADLHSQLQRDMSQVDTSLKQFYEILMNSDAAHNRDLVIFGGGKIFSMDKRHLRREAKGHEYREGMDKSVKFIEGDKNPKSSSSEGSIVPALLLDSKVGTFFKQNTVFQLYKDIYHGRAPPFNFRSAKGDKKLPEPWPTVEKQIKGLRVHIMKSNNQPNISSYVASTLSKMPISDLRVKIIGTEEYEPLSDYFKRMGFGHIDPRLPAVMISLARKIKDSSKDEDVRSDPNQPTSSKGDEKKVKEKKTRSPDVCDPSYSYYPMEHCIIAANQRVNRQKMLSDPERAVPPHKRYEEILNGLHALNLDESGRHNRVLAAFGVEVSSRPRQVEGIRRQAPKIQFANNQEARMNSDSCNWDGKGLRVSHPGQIDNIVCIYTDARDRQIIEQAVGKLRTMAQSLGIKIGAWNIEPRAYTPEELADLMKELKSKQEATKKRYLLLHFDDKGSKSHAQLKLLERRYSIVTQQITVDKAKGLPRQAQTAQNILLKLNCKIGGLNYQVIPESYSQNRWTNSKRVMFVGYDVAHPGPQSRDDVARKIPPGSPSIVGFSFNGAPNPEAFIGDFHYQTPKQERVHEEMLHQRMKWMLKLFKKNRGDLPEVIFVTRDGISEGQYEMAMTMELPSLRDACTEFGEENNKPGYKPKFILIIATKRHSTRAFLIEHNRVNNPKPLTVIDNTITRPNISEFYLQSAKPIIGTGKPTYYQILVDDLNLSMDEIQATMAALCFTHQIVNSPVSIPEPVYQADEWAKRGNQVWQAYEDNYTLPHKKEKGDYSDFPIDFEVMTERLSYWNSPLEMYRVNA